MRCSLVFQSTEYDLGELTSNLRREMSKVVTGVTVRSGACRWPTYLGKARDFPDGLMFVAIDMSRSTNVARHLAALEKRCPQVLAACDRSGLFDLTPKDRRRLEFTISMSLATDGGYCRLSLSPELLNALGQRSIRFGGDVLCGQ